MFNKNQQKSSTGNEVTVNHRWVASLLPPLSLSFVFIPSFFSSN